MNVPRGPLTGDFAIVEDVVHRYLQELATFGLEFERVTLDGSPKLQPFVTFHFLHNRSGIRVDIAFFAAAQGKNGGFTVLIVDRGNRKLNVEDYLKAHGREDLSPAFRYRHPESKLEDFATTFLQILCGLFGGELKPVLEGQVFEETAIDWMGYR